MEVAHPNFELLGNLRTFLSGASRGSKNCDIELTKTALSLLKTLPVSRDAVLEYFCLVFDNVVKKYAAQVNNDQLMNSPVPISQQEEEVLGEIHRMLCSFVSSSPQAWAPIISTWAFQLLGRLSSKYNVLSASSGLNETLHWWMSCKAVRTLIDITTQCLHCLMHTETESCVSTLLDTSVAHSPHFDWVVAIVGSCFSKTVITRVLSLGLKDFSSGGSSKSSKLKSVVGILGHLGNGHFADVRGALLELFLWGQDLNGDQDQQKLAVIPYLLQLASQSQVLLNALSTDVLQKLNVNTLNAMGVAASFWVNYLDDDVHRLEDLAVSLALRCERGGAKLVSLLLDGAEQAKREVALTCEILLELLIEEIDVELRSNRGTSVALLSSLKAESSQIQTLLLTESPKRQRILCRILRLLEFVNQSVPTEAAHFLLQNGRETFHMQTLIILSAATYNSSNNLLSTALEQGLRRSPSTSLWKNIVSLLRLETSVDDSGNGVVAHAVLSNLLSISSALKVTNGGQLQPAILEALVILPSSCLAKLPLQLSLRLTTNTVAYFFKCISLFDKELCDINCRRACIMLQRLCRQSVAARAAAIRELLQTSIFHLSGCFGSNRRPIQRLVDVPYSLTDENYKLKARSKLTGRQSTAFGNTVILHSNAASISTTPDPSAIESNILYLIEAVKSCCTASNGLSSFEDEISLDAAVEVALLLVELISPDVMYNGLPWPEEDFCKVTIERDIHIRKVFEDVPLTWRLLEMLARHQPALCYCSVLLRALIATLLSRWSWPSPPRLSELTSTTLRVLNLMNIGQLLPHPLTYLPEIIPLVTPQEVLSMLRGCVWNYMRDHVPAPALFNEDPRSRFMWRDMGNARTLPLIYVEPMRLVILNNIRHFGNLYYNLFIRP